MSVRLGIWWGVRGSSHGKKCEICIQNGAFWDVLRGKKLGLKIASLTNLPEKLDSNMAVIDKEISAKLVAYCEG